MAALYEYPCGMHHRERISDPSVSTHVQRVETWKKQRGEQRSGSRGSSTSTPSRTSTTATTTAAAAATTTTTITSTTTTTTTRLGSAPCMR
jgi:hypothetical protein